MANQDATDAAREHAAEKGIAGKDGRVTAHDVDAAAANDGVDDDQGEALDTASGIDEVEVPTLEDQREDAEAALEAHDIDPDDLYAKEAVLPPNAQPSGGTLPRVEEQVGPPLTEDQLRQLAEQQAATEAVADAAGWEQDESAKEQPEEIAPEDADNPEPEAQIEPNPVEALAERKAQNRADGEPPLPGSAEERQRDGASDDSVRAPLLQRPAEEQGGHATHQGTVRQEGDTRPGERSLDNDSPAFQTAVNHVPGTPLPADYYETAGPAPQPALHEKRTQEELDELNGDQEDDA